MLLKELVTSCEILKVSGDLEQEIRGLCYDSRAAGPGDLFFALKGVSSDGHRFIGKAVAAGAAAVVLEDVTSAPPDIPWVQAADGRSAMARMAARFYGDPTAGIPVVGITGTNGKTTTTYLVEAILAAAGIPAAVLGTISYRFGARTIPAPHTTPESVDLQRTLRELVELGARAVVMEVSSHALEQRRVDGCQFDVGVFTNLTPEHLDYHGTMEAYLASKQRLFAELLRPDQLKRRRCGAVNLDDPAGPAIAAAAACPVITYGLAENAQVTAQQVEFSVNGISALLVTPAGEVRFVSRLLGRFNLSNILAAVAAGVALGIPLEAIRAGVEGHQKVPGRLEPVENSRGITLLVDYAHTGDALENVLKTVKEIAQRRIITVFGCGGDRDRTKRPVMGRIAGAYSDLTVITSDNPRTEEPQAIIAEIRAGIAATGTREYQAEELTAGFADKGFVTVESRREAIRLAVRLAEPGDVVLLAGKGHEDYQIIGTERHHFDDREEAVAAFRELG